MAFAGASKSKVSPLASLLKNLLLSAPSSSALRPAPSVATARRLFSTAGGAPFSRVDDTISDEEFLLFHQGAHPTLRSTVSVCRAWVSKLDANAVQVKMEMPGLSAEHVKVWTYPRGLLVKGEAGDAVADPKNYLLYTGRIEPPSLEAFGVGKAQAEMKDGVLTITVPRPRVKNVDPGDKSTEIKVRKG